MAPKMNFGKEVAKVHPVILREVLNRQESIYKEENMTLSNIVLLDALRQKGALTMTEIATIMGLSMGAATGIVDKMIEQKIVERERSEEDRRVVLVKFLKKGQDLAEKINQYNIDMVNDIYGVLTEDEKAEFLRMMKKVAASLMG